ncbi:TetR/AcrR family transcriptional regulator [Streptomyces capparidis]
MTTQQTHLEEIGEAVARHLTDTGREAADLTLADLAEIVGISRATLLRRIGSRAALDNVLAAAGIPQVKRPAATERCIHAAAHLYARHGVAEVTLEHVAANAGCTVQAIHSGLGGRDGLLLAVFERYSPLPRMAAAKKNLPTHDLTEGARTLYTHILASLLGDPPVLPNLIVEVLSRPRGTLATHVRTSYAPRAAELVEDWLAGHITRGTARPLPRPTLMSLFAGPVLLQSTLATVTGHHPTETDKHRIANDLAISFCHGIST